MKKYLFCALLTWGCCSTGIAAESEEQFDARTSLHLTPSEKAEFLSEMRQMLASIQGIISGIAEENPDKIIQSARYSGNRMARATPESVKKKTPQAFKEIGGPTHMMFEELVIRAETDDMQTLTEITGHIMQQCLACHAIYRAN
jgi:cytochrome c556